MVKIRNDIPAPIGERKRRSPNLPWSSLEVGESFFVRNRNTAAAGCLQHGAKLDRKFTYEARSETDDEGKPVNGYRIWRVE